MRGGVGKGKERGRGEDVIEGRRLRRGGGAAGRTYVAAGIVVEETEIGDWEVECAGDFLGRGEDRGDGIVGHLPEGG